MEDLLEALVTLNTAAAATLACGSMTAGSITWSASVIGGKPHVLVQVRTDDAVSAFAAHLGVEARLADSRGLHGHFEYLVASKQLELLDVRVMGPHHKLVREAA